MLFKQLQLFCLSSTIQIFDQFSVFQFFIWCNQIPATKQPVLWQDVCVEMRYLQLSETFQTLYLWSFARKGWEWSGQILPFPRCWHRLIRVVRLTSSSKLNVKRRLMFLLLTLSTGKCFIGINHCSAGTATLSNISISNLAPGVQRYDTAAATVWSRPPRTPSLPSLPPGDGEIVYLYVRETARGF